VGAYQLCRALHHVYIHREAGLAARNGDFSSLAGFKLTAEERMAIERRDLVELYRLGAHPLVLFHFATVLQPRESYVRDVAPRLRGIPNPFYYGRPAQGDRTGGS